MIWNCGGVSARKTPLALTLAPEAKLNGKFVKNFIDMFGDTPMAQANSAVSRHDAAGRGKRKAARGGAAGAERICVHGMMGADYFSAETLSARPVPKNCMRYWI